MKTVKTGLWTGSVLLVFLLLGLASCNKEEQGVTPPAEGNEFLTTVILRLTNPGNAADTANKTAVWRKLDPTSVNPPDTSHALLVLKPNTTYHCSLSMLDETKTPAQSISDVVRQRANYHLFFFFASQGLELTVNRTDHDTNNPPLELGLESDFVTGAAGTGRLNVVLRHQPNVKDGTFAPGSTDTDVNFTIDIQN